MQEKEAEIQGLKKRLERLENVVATLAEERSLRNQNAVTKVGNRLPEEELE